MYAASAFEIVSTLKDGAATANEDWLALAIAFIASAITAFVSVKWLLGYIQTNRFTAFAVYRVLFGGLLFAMILIFVQWVRESNREARRVDRALDREEAERAKQGAARYDGQGQDSHPEEGSHDE